MGSSPTASAMTKDIVLRPQPNKGRMGHRGKKQRHSVFKAERNQEYEPQDEVRFKHLCTKYSLVQEDYFNSEDGTNRKWFYALHRLETSLFKTKFLQLCEECGFDQNTFIDGRPVNSKHEWDKWLKALLSVYRHLGLKFEGL